MGGINSTADLRYAVTCGECAYAYPVEYSQGNYGGICCRLAKQMRTVSLDETKCFFNIPGIRIFKNEIKRRRTQALCGELSKKGDARVVQYFKRKGA